MKKADLAKKYLINKITDTKSFIKNVLQNKANCSDREIEYMFSMFKKHIGARIYINTQKLVGADLQKQINIRENNLEFLNIELDNHFDKNSFTKEIVVDKFKTLADYEEKLFVIQNLKFLKKAKTVAKVCHEMEK